jgi:hypothetical protein
MFSQFLILLERIRTKYYVVKQNNTSLLVEFITSCVVMYSLKNNIGVSLLNIIVRTGAKIQMDAHTWRKLNGDSANIIGLAINKELDLCEILCYSFSLLQLTCILIYLYWLMNNKIIFLDINSIKATLKPCRIYMVITFIMIQYLLLVLSINIVPFVLLYDESLNISFLPD